MADEKLVKVKYEGGGNVYNYDVAPYNLVKDESSGVETPKALLSDGDQFEVPESLAERLFVTRGFFPVGKDAKKVADKQGESPQESSSEGGE